MASIGQLAATTPASIIPASGGQKPRCLSLIFYNASVATPQQIEVTVTRGGTELTFVKATLQIKEQLVVSNLNLEATDVVKAASTSATSTNYMVLPGNPAAAMDVYGVDAAGARKQAGTLGSTTITGDLTLSGGADLAFSGTTGQSQITLTDNLADALSVCEAANDYIVITTTNSAERVKVGKLLGQSVVATPVAAAGAGGGVAGAAALSLNSIVVVSSDGATKGVKLNTGVAGDVVTIINSSGTACNLFAAAGGTINGGAADAGCTIPASKGVLAVCTAADTWTVYDLPAKAGAAA